MQIRIWTSLCLFRAGEAVGVDVQVERLKAKEAVHAVVAVKRMAVE